MAQNKYKCVGKKTRWLLVEEYTTAYENGQLCPRDDHHHQGTSPYALKGKESMVSLEVLETEMCPEIPCFCQENYSLEW